MSYEHLNHPEAQKVLITAGEDGLPHAAVKSSLQYADGKILYWELLESSVSNRNMTYAVWFDRKVHILFTLPDGGSWEVSAKVEYAAVSGSLFREHFIKSREYFKHRFGLETDLATVWFLTPLGSTEKTLSHRLAEEAARHPWYSHLDLLAKEATQ